MRSEWAEPDLAGPDAACAVSALSLAGPGAACAVLLSLGRQSLLLAVMLPQ